jgi:hypothetical protein
MPPRKKTIRRKPAAAKSPRRRRSSTKALAIGDAVRRETLGRSMLDRQLSVLDRQLAVFEAMMAWSPARMLLNQQAAFWEGFSAPEVTRRAPPRKRVQKRAAKRG